MQDLNNNMECCETMNGYSCSDITINECPTENVCHRSFVHNVFHIAPCNTRIINHHIYRHTYVPMYTSCEENVVCNEFQRPSTL